MGNEIVRMLLVLLVLAGAVWLLIRFAVFVRALLRPILKPLRAAQRPIERKLTDQVAGALRTAGLDPLARGTEKLMNAAHRVEDAASAGLDRVERGIAERREER